MSRLLIIEPDKLLSEHLAGYFKRIGYSTTVHSDPQAALDAADKQPPDVVITELQLAGRSGAEFLYEFRSYPDWCDTPVIIFTNLHPEQIAAFGEILSDLDVSACLHKPATSLHDLLSAVQQLRPEHA